jgi:hypothetical protein
MSVAKPNPDSEDMLPDSSAYVLHFIY